MIKKGALNQLIKTCDLTSLEKHLIYSFLENSKLDYQESPILHDYFNGFEVDAELLSGIYSFSINSIKELENYLELIIPEEDRKLNGAFFTPDYVIDFIINELYPGESDTNLDPSCGCGAFLVGLTDYYKRTFNKPIKRIIKENIYGSDILKYNVHRTKLILSIYALQYEEILHESDFNIYHQDSLRAEWHQKFDNVIGNPPYVKFQDLSAENRSYLAKHWTTVEGGTFNLYFAFFELGYKLLKPNGKLGYITPNNYFTSLSGESLRKYFQKQKCVSRIIDFSHKKVFDAQTYTAITFINKKANESIAYDRIKDNQDPDAFLLNANGSLNDINNLNVKKWRLLKTDEQYNIKAIETIGTPIGKLFDICVGIATLKDEVFFIDGTKQQNGCYVKITENGVFEIEKDVVKPVYKISDFKAQNEIDLNSRKIIFPYKVSRGIATVISEIEFKKQFPKCYAYLLSEKDTLLSRDKGKVIFDPFYVWGRTQGLTRTGKRLLTPTFSQHPRFLIVEEEDAYFTNGYGLYFKEHKLNGLFADLNNRITKIENIDVVQKILNSYIMDYYISKTSVAIEGGYPCYQKNFIEKFTIPELTESEIQTIRDLNDTSHIDEFLIQKYQLELYVPNLSL